MIGLNTTRKDGSCNLSKRGCSLQKVEGLGPTLEGTDHMSRARQAAWLTKPFIGYRDNGMDCASVWVLIQCQ